MGQIGPTKLQHERRTVPSKLKSTEEVFGFMNPALGVHVQYSTNERKNYASCFPCHAMSTEKELKVTTRYPYGTTALRCASSRSENGRGIYFLTIAANTPRQSRLVSRVRSLRMRACCCTCIGLNRCRTRPFFSIRSSLESAVSLAAAVRAGWWIVVSAVPSCLG